MRGCSSLWGGATATTFAGTGMGTSAICPQEAYPDGDFVRFVGGWFVDAGEDMAFILEFANLDVDANGLPDALTDGILMLRFLFGFTGDALIGGGVLASDCTRCAGEEIEPYVQALGLDVDGNGSVDALTDGILVLRFLFGFEGESLINGVLAPDCTRCTAEEIRGFLEMLSP